MQDATMYRYLADGVLFVHFAVIVFVGGGLVAVVVGNLCRWRWVNSFIFRTAHLVAIGIVVLQAWLGQLCPLTTLESWLRLQAGENTYAVSFIEHWVQRIIFYEAPFWVFTLAYTVFGLLVAVAWWYFPPKRTPRHNPSSTT